MTSSGPDLVAVIAELADGCHRVMSRHGTGVAVGNSARGLTQTKLIEARLIEARSGFVLSALSARLMAAWRAADPVQPGAAVALALETAALVHADSAARRSDVVISARPATPQQSGLLAR